MDFLDGIGSASTASFRNSVGIFKKILFLNSSLLKASPDILRQHEKQLTLEFNRQGTGGVRKVEAGDLSATNDENRLLASKQFRGILAKFSDSGKNHVVTKTKKLPVRLRHRQLLKKF